VEGEAADEQTQPTAGAEEPDAAGSAAPSPETATQDSSEEAAQETETDEPDAEVTVEYVASVDGAGQVAAGFGDHEFEDFTDEWTDTEETDSMNASISVEADEGAAACEIIVDGETLAEEVDESGSVYCSAVVGEP